MGIHPCSFIYVSNPPLFIVQHSILSSTVCLSINENIGCFQFGTLKNKAAENILVQVLEVIYVYVMLMFSLGGSDGKESACNTRDLDLILGLGKSPGEGNGYPIHCSCLENSMDRGVPMGSQKVGYD